MSDNEREGWTGRVRERHAPLTLLQIVHRRDSLSRGSYPEIRFSGLRRLTPRGSDERLPDHHVPMPIAALTSFFIAIVAFSMALSQGTVASFS